MKRIAKPSSGGSSSGSGSRLRLTILLATVAAFFLVPAAQAAAGTFTVNVAGSGSGTVTGYGEEFTAGGVEIGAIPINCSGPPPSGECGSTWSGHLLGIELTEAAVPGSEFAGWTVAGASPEENCEEGEEECWALAFEGASPTVTATFTCVEECGPPPVTLKVEHEGTGSGTVQSNPAGIEACGGTCEAGFAPASTVTLTASPGLNSAFTSWKGCGSVEGRKCTVTMSAAKTVKAKFSPTYAVTVKKTTGNTGLGSISGVTCDANCSSATGSFAVGKAAKLAPKPSKGSAFTEWSSCPGTVVEVNKCEMTSAGTAEAKFTAIPKFALTVNKAGGGAGTVKSTPASISCGLTCSTMTSSFEEGKEVELLATVQAGKGSTFTEWSVAAGTCTGATNPCKVTMGAAHTVTAKFE